MLHPGMCDNPVILNLHLRETGLLYRQCDVRPQVVEGRSLTADTHLALLGVKRQERHSGTTKDILKNKRSYKLQKKSEAAKDNSKSLKIRKRVM